MSDASHAAVLRLLMSTAELGATLTGRMADASKEPDLTGNLPLIVMCALDLDGPQRPSAIQDVTGLSSGGVTKLLDRMEARGAVSRAYGAVPEDHRAVIVTLTPYGRRVLRSMTTAAANSLPELRSVVAAMSSALDEM